MPAKKGKQPDEKFPLKLTVKQRESLGSKRSFSSFCHLSD